MLLLRRYNPYLVKFNLVQFNSIQLMKLALNKAPKDSLSSNPHVFSLKTLDSFLCQPRGPISWPVYAIF